MLSLGSHLLRSGYCFSLSLSVCVLASPPAWETESSHRWPVKICATLPLVLRQQTSFASSIGIHFDIVSESKSSFERYLLDRKTSRLWLLFNSTLFALSDVEKCWHISCTKGHISIDNRMTDATRQSENRKTNGRWKIFDDTKSHGSFTAVTGDPVSPLTLRSNYSANISPTTPSIICSCYVRRRRCIHFVCT